MIPGFTISFPLTICELSSLYYRLQNAGGYCLGKDFGHFKTLSLEECLAIACEASRWDPRLLEILVDYFYRHYPDVRPFVLNRLVKSMATPQTIGVVLAFGLSLGKSDELKAFYQIVTAGISRASSYALYSLNYSLGIKRLHLEARGSLSQYKQWAFLCSNLPVLKHLLPNPRLIRYSKETRMALLKTLFAQKKEICLGDYIQVIHHTITRQHARLDLLSLPNIMSSGTTRGVRYFMKPKILLAK